MKKKPPSLQHVARFYQPTPEGVKKEVLKLAAARPPFSYEDLYQLIWDMVRLDLPERTIADAASKIKQKVKRESYLRAIPPTAKYFDGFQRAYTIKVEPRAYSVGRDLRVPFSPPMICGTSQGLVLPWLMFWKVNPLTRPQISLFVSMVDDVLRDDSDLSDAKLAIVDTSAKALRDGVPTVLWGDEIPKLSQQEKARMLAIVVDGMQLALAELPTASRRERSIESEIPSAFDQLTFFDA